MATASDDRNDGLYSYDSFGNNGKTPTSSNFLWWCAGAHQKLLRKYPSEGVKYAGLGGVLLATFALATLSSGYAIYSVFGHWGWTLLFAAVWGLIIFNFDRFLVSTMRKYGVSRQRQVLLAVPRLGLALLIGLTIARPLELKLFEKEIAIKMVENGHKKMQRNDSLLQIENRNLVQTTEAERQQLINRRQQIEDTLGLLQSAYVQEADGTGGSGKRGIEKLTQLKMQAYQNASGQFQPQLAEIATGIRQKDSLIAAARASLEDKRKAYETTAAINQGFLERNKALADLSEEESSVWWSSLMISLLIILIEIGPILSKLIMPIGPYDIALAREELLHMADDENEIRKSKEVLYEKRRLFYQKQKETSDMLVDKLSELQRKHIDEELDKWERGEWSAKDYKASMDEVMRKIKRQYQVGDEDLL
jgi:hypothetical protein